MCLSTCLYLCLFFSLPISIFLCFCLLGGENHHDPASGHEAATALHHTQQQDRDFVVSCHRRLRFIRRLLLHPSAPNLLTLIILCCRLTLLHTAHTHTSVGGLGKHKHTGAIMTMGFHNHIKDLFFFLPLVVALDLDFVQCND